MRRAMTSKKPTHHNGLQITGQLINRRLQLCLSYSDLAGGSALRMSSWESGIVRVRQVQCIATACSVKKTACQVFGWALWSWRRTRWKKVCMLLFFGRRSFFSAGVSRAVVDMTNDFDQVHGGFRASACFDSARCSKCSHLLEAFFGCMQWQ